MTHLIALLLALGVGASNILAAPRGASSTADLAALSRPASVSASATLPGAPRAVARRPTPRPTTAPLAPGTAVVRVGIASTYGPGFSERWVALPEGPGWAFTVCGAGGCRDLVSTDAGPDLAMQRAGRVVDLPVGAFAAVCGVPWTMGLCPVTVTILGRVK